MATERISNQPAERASELNAQPSELLFQVAQEADKEKVIALCSEVHEETRSPRNREPFQVEQWLWQNWNSWPVPGLITIAQDGEEVCGVFAMPGRMVSVNGQIGKSGMVQSLLTKSTHRRRGVFVKMGRYALEQAPITGLDFCYSFPNNRSINGFTRRLGFRLIATIPLYIKLHLVAWAWGLVVKPFRKLGRSGNQESEKITHVIGNKNIVPMEQFNGSFDQLWEHAGDAHRVSLVRNSAYLNGRFKLCPNPPYHVFAAVVDEKVQAYIVYRFAKILSLPACVIMDFLASDTASDHLTTLIRYVDKTAKAQGAVVTMAPFKGNDYLVQAFKRAGFITIPSRFSIRPLNLVVRTTSSRLPENDILDPSKWFITLADWDVL